MEPETQTPAAAPSDGAVAATAPEPADSGPVGYSRGSFEDVFSQAFAPAPTPAAVLNGATAEADDDEEGDPDGDEPAEPVAASVTPDEKTGDEPPAKPLSRREQERADHLSAIAERDAEIARIAAERETDAQRIRNEARAEYESEQKRLTDEAAAAAQTDEARAEVERYNRLLATLDEDLTPEDYVWREERKALLKSAPQAEKHWRTQAQVFVEQKTAELEKGQSAFWIDVRSQMAGIAADLGIDMKTAWDTPGKTWKDIGESIKQSAEARATERVTAELTGRVEKAEADALRLTKANQDLQDQILGQTKAPATAGRSSGAGLERPEANYRGTWQDNLKAGLS